MAEDNGRSMLLPILIAMFGGGLPILFGGDVRLFMFITLIFLGLGMILLMVRLGVARKAILLSLGASLIINPNKFFMMESLTTTFFGGLPVPFISLTDLVVVALLWNNFSIKTDSRPCYHNKFITVALLVWIISMAFSLIAALHPIRGFWHMTFEWKCILLFFSIVTINQGQTSAQIFRDLRLIFFGISTGVFVETMAVLAEYTGAIGTSFSFFGIQIGGYQETLGGITTNRVGGTYRHPNYLAIPMAALLIPSVAMTLRTKGMHRLLFGGTAACAFLNLLLTLSRGGWLAAAVSSLLFLSVLLATHEGLALLKRNGRLIFIIVFFVMVTFGALSDTIMRKLYESSDTNISSRVVLYEMALDMIQDHPLTGVGLNNSTTASGDYMDMFMNAWSLPPVIHNIFLLIGAEVGIPGLLAFVFFTLYLLIRGLALAQKQIDSGGDEPFFLAALAAGGMAYLTADMFGPGLRMPEISYLFWSHLGMVALLTKTIFHDQRLLSKQRLDGVPN